MPILLAHAGVLTAFPASTSVMSATDIAAINATVLTVLFTGVSAFVLIVVQHLHEMETDLVEEARAINRMGFESWSGTRRYAPDRREQRYRFVDRVIALLQTRADDAWNDMPKPPEAEEWLPEAHRDMPLTYGRRGQEALEILSEMCSDYPFPQRFVAVEGGNPQWEIHGLAVPVDIGTAKDVEVWLADMTPLIGWLQVATQFNAQRAFDAAEDDHRDSWPTPVAPETSDAYLQSFYRELADRGAMFSPARSGRSIIDYVKAVAGLVERTHVLRAKREGYLRRLPPRGAVIGLLLALFSAFAIGVIVPMLRPTFSSYAAAAIPGALYIATMCGGIVALFRFYGSSTRKADGVTN